MWTKETLQDTLREKMGDFLLVIASNRQPYQHIIKSGKKVCLREPGGLVTALNPVMEAAQGTWVAMGVSELDKQVLNDQGKVALPPENPSYHLRRIFVSKQDLDAYYYGYANEGLWPLCHIAFARPVFEEMDWQAYQKVNRLFADTILAEVGTQNAFVWIHDFHLTLVAKYLREAGATNIITAIFWHIPWPNTEVFGTCPQKTEILDGLLAYDLIGFQIRQHEINFLNTIEREMESRIDLEKEIPFFIKTTKLLYALFPISVDATAIAARAESATSAERMQHYLEELSLDGKTDTGVDRLDYTKGIPERLRAIDRFLDKYPEYKEQFVFCQIGQLSRLRIQRYKDLNDEVSNLVEEINWKHSQGSWTPIAFLHDYVPYEDIIALYRLADACLVTSLHDGMNLVAKEFVATRSDLMGVLILSQFTGASKELTDALLVNPYDTENMASAIYQALNMPEEEQKKRMTKMREIVEFQNIYRWAGKVLSQLFKFEFQEV